jgi:hypothetical protein
VVGNRIIGFKILFNDGTSYPPIMINEQQHFIFWKNEYLIYGNIQHSGITIIPIYQ